MSVTLKIDNYNANNITEQTTLSADANSGQAVLNAQSANGFDNNEYVLAGEVGSESAELKQILSISTNAITLTSNLSANHAKYEKLYALYGNQIRIYRASNVDGTQPDDADFAVLTTVAIDADQTSTSYTDATGSDDYWYKFTYYNSTTSAGTPLADSRAVRGSGSDSGNYCSIELIRKVAGLQTNTYVTDADIDQKRQAAQDEIDGALVGKYTLPFTDPVPPIIEDICARLSAGLLLTSAWSGSYSSTNSEGQDKLDKARADLMALQKKQTTVVVNGSSLAIENIGGFKSYPDASTIDQPVSEGGRMFSQEDRY